MTPIASNVVAFAIDEARESGTDLTDMYLLHGLLHEAKEGVAGGVLRNLGIEIRTETREVVVVTRQGETTTPSPKLPTT